MTPKLTLNLGLRYEWSTPYSERHNLEQFSDFSASSGVDVPGVGTVHGTTVFASGSQRTIPVDRNNWAPRVGFAYQVNDRTVVRGRRGRVLRDERRHEFSVSRYGIQQHTSGVLHEG